LLDTDRFNHLLDIGVAEFQISLDGEENFHDKTRLRRNGTGSFKRIYSNLLSMRSCTRDFKVILRVHLTGDNLASVAMLSQALAGDFGNDTRFKVYFKTVNALGGPHDAQLNLIKRDQRDTVRKQLIDAFPHKNQVFNLEEKSNYICYAAAGNSLAIRANGDIAKCTVALDDPKNKVGHINPDGTLSIDNHSYRRWISALLSGDKNVLACPVRYVQNMDT